MAGPNIFHPHQAASENLTNILASSCCHSASRRVNKARFLFCFSKAVIFLPNVIIIITRLPLLSIVINRRADFLPPCDFVRQNKCLPIFARSNTHTHTHTATISADFFHFPPAARQLIVVVDFLPLVSRDVNQQLLSLCSYLSSFAKFAHHTKFTLSPLVRLFRFQDIWHAITLWNFYLPQKQTLIYRL